MYENMVRYIYLSTFGQRSVRGVTRGAIALAGGGIDADGVWGAG